MKIERKQIFGAKTDTIIKGALKIKDEDAIKLH